MNVAKLIEKIKCKIVFFLRWSRRAAKNAVLRALLALGVLPERYRYSLKEDYVSRNVNLAWWEKHISYTVLKQYAPQLRGVVADFGCNHGTGTILAARNQNVETIIGFDLNAKAIRTAEKLLRDCGEPEEVKRKVHFVKSMLDHIEVPDDYFDGAIMFHVLEHIYPANRPAVFKELQRVLKPGAFFLIVLPYEHAYDDGIQHVAFFNVETLTDLLQQSGFEVVECYRDTRGDAYRPEGHDCLNAVCRNKR